MSDNVIDLNETLLKRGESMFILCPCGQEEGFDLVVVQGKSHPVITSAVCRSCNKGVPVIGGELQE